MKDAFIDLVVLVLTLTGVMLKTAFRVLIFLGVLFVIGMATPYVLAALGFPQHTAYELLAGFFSSIYDFMATHMQGPPSYSTR